MVYMVWAVFGWWSFLGMLLRRSLMVASCSVHGGCLRVMRVCRRWWCGVGGGCDGVFMFGVDVYGRVVVLSL